MGYSLLSLLDYNVGNSLLLSILDLYSCKLLETDLPEQVGVGCEEGLPQVLKGHRSQVPVLGQGRGVAGTIVVVGCLEVAQGTSGQG